MLVFQAHAVTVVGSAFDVAEDLSLTPAELLRETEVIVNVAKSVTQELDMTSVCNLILASSRSLVGCDRCSLFLLDENSQVGPWVGTNMILVLI